MAKFHENARALIPEAAAAAAVEQEPHRDRVERFGDLLARLERARRSLGQRRGVSS